jgi:hypothetical protein
VEKRNEAGLSTSFIEARQHAYEGWKSGRGDDQSTVRRFLLRQIGDVKRQEWQIAGGLEHRAQGREGLLERVLDPAFLLEDENEEEEKKKR